MSLIYIDQYFNVTIADPNSGKLKKDTLTNMVSYICDNSNANENGYILIKNDVKSTSGDKR